MEILPCWSDLFFQPQLLWDPSEVALDNNTFVGVKPPQLRLDLGTNVTKLGLVNMFLSIHPGNSNGDRFGWL